MTPESGCSLNVDDKVQFSLLEFNPVNNLGRQMSVQRQFNVELMLN